MSGTDIKIFKNGSLDDIAERGIESNSAEVWDVVDALKVDQIHFDYILYMEFLELNFLPQIILKNHGTFVPWHGKENFYDLRSVKNLSHEVADEAWMWFRLWLGGHSPGNKLKWLAFLTEFDYFRGYLSSNEICHLSKSSEPEGFLPYLATLITNHAEGKYFWLRELEFFDKMIDDCKTRYNDHIFLTFNIDT